MKTDVLLTLVLLSAACAVAVVIICNLLGFSSPTTLGAGVAGGVAGAISGSRLKRK